MIFTERTIKIANDVCKIDNPIVLYRGDYNVEIRFTIVECPYKYSTKNSTNIIETVDASYGQLVIKVPNDGLPIFSDVVETNKGSIVFTISGEMIDESIEVGDYTFQIRLFDANKESRATIPPVENGISIREPLAFEDVTTTNEVDLATVGYALTTTGDTVDVFDTNGNYIKTNWATGNRITAAKLNKIEAGIDGVNKKVASGGTGGQGMTEEQAQQLNTAYTHSQSAHVQQSDIPTKTSQLENDSNFATQTYVNNKIAEASLSGGSVDLSGYVTKETGNANQITFSDGQTFQAKLDAGTLKGDKGDKGDTGPQGPAGTDGLTTSIVLNDVTYTQQNGVITLPNISSSGEVVPVAQVEPAELDMPRVFFYGNALPTSKTDVLLTMDYISNTTKFSSYIKLKCQGTSSMSYAKKNFTVNMYSDEARETKLKKDFKGWGAQSKFCLKANWVDTTHTRNISGARIAYDMVQSRPNSTFKQQLLTAPRYGLVDGFPIKLYFNGEFYGIYTWNIPKDDWMFNMDKSNPNHIVLCAEKNTDGNSNLINSCQFRQLWNGVDGGDWSYEVGTPSNTVKDSLNRCIGFVMNATDQEFHDNIGQYFDLYSLLDYYCFSYFTAHIDGLAKNMLMATYDGVIWGACLYDMDSIYGAWFNGASFVATNYRCPEQYQEQFSRLWQRIEACFGAELYARYLELRQGALSLGNIVKHVEEIYDVIPDRVFADEKAKWTNLPQVANNTMTRFRNYMRDRAAYVDAQMLEIGSKVACTGITLSANNLSFTTTDTQTLTATVEPIDTTDVVAWSVSPNGIVTVDGGVVTPVTNGDCTITATCGTQTATCTVNVALPLAACTSITLDKTELSLGRSGEITTENVTTNWVNGYIQRTQVAVNNGIAGTVKGSDVDITTDFISVNEGDTIVISLPSTVFVGCVAYDYDKQYLSTYTPTQEGTGGEWNTTGIIKDTKASRMTVSNIPEGACYIRCCFNLATADSISITQTSESENLRATLVATVEPSNTTDEVIWSVSPLGIITVDNGIVTAKANGEAIITASCGTQSTTCNVTVSGLSTELA